MSYVHADFTKSYNPQGILGVGKVVDRSNYCFYPITVQGDPHKKFYFGIGKRFTFGVQEAEFRGEPTGRYNMSFAIGQKDSQSTQECPLPAIFSEEEKAILQNFATVESIVSNWVLENKEEIIEFLATRKDNDKLIKKIRKGKSYLRTICSFPQRAGERDESKPAYLYSNIIQIPKKEVRGTKFDKLDPSNYDFVTSVYLPGNRATTPLEVVGQRGDSYPSFILEHIRVGTEKLTISIKVNDVTLIPSNFERPRFAPRIAEEASSSYDPSNCEKEEEESSGSEEDGYDEILGK